MKFKEYVGSRLWPVPVVAVIMGVILALVLPEVDEATAGDLTFAYGAPEAIEVLSSISAGMIVFTGFVFSVLLLIVQFGSAQYSPRLLRTLSHARAPKIALGTFIATFTYSLLVLSSLESRGRQGFVPSLAVTFAIVLVLLSVLMFLLLVQDAYAGLSPGSITRFVGMRGRRAIESVHPLPAAPSEEASPATDYGTTLPARTAAIDHEAESAVLQHIDRDRLVAIASSTNVRLILIPAIGDFVPRGSPVFYVLGSAPDVDVRGLRAALSFGVDRTSAQDPGQPLRFLVDIAIKALSPAINDPTTAVQALNQIEDLLRMLGTRSLSNGEARDGAGVVRLVYRTPSWEDYLSLALWEIRRVGAGSPQVERRLRSILLDLEASVPAYRVAAVHEQLQLLDEAVTREFGGSELELALEGDHQGIGSTRVHGRLRSNEPTSPGTGEG